MNPPTSPTVIADRVAAIVLTVSSVLLGAELLWWAIVLMPNP
jgi:hypothetical protein